MAMVALLAVLLALFTLGIYLLDKLASRWRHRAALQTWLRVFYGEICLLLLVSGKAHLTGLHEFKKADGGYIYLVQFTVGLKDAPAKLLHGRWNDELLLLALPLVPALVVYWVQHRRLTRPPAPPGPPHSEPWSVARWVAVWVAMSVGLVLLPLVLVWWLSKR